MQYNDTYDGDVRPEKCGHLQLQLKQLFAWNQSRRSYKETSALQSSLKMMIVTRRRRISTKCEHLVSDIFVVITNVYILSRCVLGWGGGSDRSCDWFTPPPLLALLPVTSFHTSCLTIFGRAAAISTSQVYTQPRDSTDTNVEIFRWSLEPCCKKYTGSCILEVQNHFDLCCLAFCSHIGLYHNWLHSE